MIPVVGLAVAVSLTVPEKPLMLATVMMAEPHVPGEISSQFELTEKSPVAKTCPTAEKLTIAIASTDRTKLVFIFFLLPLCIIVSCSSSTHREVGHI